LSASAQENIDVLNYTNNTQLYIQRALSPAKITSIKIDESVNGRGLPKTNRFPSNWEGGYISSCQQLTDTKLMYTAKRNEDRGFNLDEFVDKLIVDY
jgi:N utilization substance protein A